jgi:hypothetical protein
MPLFSFYVEPGVYVKTIRAISGVPVPSNLRLPLIIGEGAETVPVESFQMVRASSNSVDNYSKSENVTERFLDNNDLFQTPDATTRRFQVKNVPIVTGEGTGVITTDPAHVTVTINDLPASVLKVEGTTGIVHLGQLPIAGDVVKASYYYDKRDTLLPDEDLSFQVDGTKDTFKVRFPRIVDGTHGGVTTASPTDITVKVDGVLQTVTSLDGALGVFTLSAAPAAGTTLLVTYYSNRFEDTSDPFPEANIVKINSVGNNPGRTDYINTVDYVLADDTITWGSAAKARIGETTPGGAVFDEDSVELTLVDNKFYFEELSGTVDSLNKEFTSASTVMDGSGRSKPTDDPTLVQVYVGTDPTVAKAAGEVVVAELYGATRKFVLQSAPAAGQKVYATYFYNILTDASYEVTNKVAGATGVGEYTVSSLDFGDLAKVTEGTHSVSAPNFAIENIVFPNAFSDLQVFPGIALNETVTVTFTGPYNFNVTSSNINGSSGTGELGQTYVDGTTGLRFTILDPNTQTFVTSPYDFIAGDTLEFIVDVGAQILTSTIPYIQIPGLWLFLEETTGVTLDDSVEIFTYNKSGKEPAVGSLYFLDYEFEKIDFGPFVISNEKELTIAVGDINLENRLSLAGRLALRNGALLIATQQVVRELNQPLAAAQTYIEAIDAQKERLTNERNQDIIVPLTGDEDVFGFLKSHVETQSSEFNNNRRIGIVGFNLGTEPEEAIRINKSLGSERLWTVYPDGVILSVIDDAGRSIEAAVDGSFLAAAIAGKISAPEFDSATPLIGKDLVDFNRLTRRFNPIQAGEIITSGTIFLKDVGTAIRVVDAYTTRYGDLLLEEPNVTLIDDEIARDGQRALRRYVGVKSLSGIEGDIAISISKVMEAKVVSNIIRGYKDISVEIDADDPRVGYVSVAYVPIFALKWILLTLHVRSRF